MARALTIAAAQYAPSKLASLEAFAAKLEDWLGQAAAAGADLAVFPEYGLMELAGIAGEDVAADLARSLHAVADLAEEAQAIIAAAARRHGLHVLAPSGPERRTGGRFVNAARLHTPTGKVGVQEKCIMTRFEREQWDVSPGAGLAVFETALARIGVLVCYDCEFPLLGRALVEAGAELILAPSCTDTLAGYHRVAVGARARALEGQLIVVQAPLVGEAPWLPAIDVNRGAAGIYGPPDRGFPDDGILAQGTLDRPGWVTAALDLERVGDVRRTGQVLNHAHWPEQGGHGRLSAATVSLLDAPRECRPDRG
jgi:predicted amidohydrolase